MKQRSSIQFLQKVKYGLLTSCFLALAGCGENQPQSVKKVVPIRIFQPEFSKGFRMLYFANFKVAEVFQHDTVPLMRYGCGNRQALLSAFPDAVFIPEINHAVCFSTTHVAAMSLLDCRSKIIGVANAELVYDSVVASQIAAGSTLNIGKDYNPLYEKIAALRADVVFCDGEENSETTAKLHTLNQQVVSSRDYFEQRPLARAEWICFFSFFLNREQRGDSIFQAVKTAYNRLALQARNAKQHPTVFFNTPYNGVWYLPSSENYMAHLVEDAGADYVFKNEIPNNGLNLSLTFETVYSKCAKADFWLHTSGEKNLQELLAHDSRFALFHSVQTESVYCGNKRSNRAGGNDWWEKGAFLPNLFLSDLLIIFHQINYSEEDLHYYRQLHS